MSRDRREIARKLGILQHAEETGHVAGACRYLGLGRSGFCRWREACRKHADTGLVNRPPIPKWHASRTPIEIEEKVLPSSQQVPPRPHADRLVSGALPRHQDIGCHGLPDAQAQWRQPAAAWHPAAQGAHQALQQAGSGPSYPDGRQVSDVQGKTWTEDPTFPVHGD